MASAKVSITRNLDRSEHTGRRKWVENYWGIVNVGTKKRSALEVDFLGNHLNFRITVNHVIR